MRRLAVILAAASSVALFACSDDKDSDTTTTEASVDAGSGNECTAGNTLSDGVLTIGTGSPAYSPWVIDDAPESKEGFEAAVAYAIAEELGFSDANVKWVRTTFDEAIQPGAKNFDFNLQQYSITEERKATVSFSDPYYTTNQAMVGLSDSAAVGATTIADLKGLKFGAQSGTTSLGFITDVIQPDAEPYVYDDNAAAKAALEAGQVDAIVVDLPTAFYIAAVEIEGASVVGQFSADLSGQADQFGLVFDLESSLVDCVNTALATIKDNGTLAEIESTWLNDTGAPVISE
jgi:polar amino acid transport system substrate-binding protein